MEPGIGELVNERMRLSVECACCRRAVLFRPDRAVELLGAATSFRRARARLRCSTCGARDGDGVWRIDARPNWRDYYDQIAEQGAGVGYRRDAEAQGAHDAGWAPVEVVRAGAWPGPDARPGHPGQIAP